ncbi:hypothetical protein BF93_04125 [Brachybacterium phenoliresistens]|uniref:ABC transporter substrate-binding protein n=1 Tax=Brachybacterium phenoliresistens TaxID=396014 RepID=Z9JPR4_9MICO|nr:extracellular solute-binding protein [Brachybacterium phenoliresistens]EWS80390.1 hypothetical protein BF93_04125 [Brachybacterium phenoliresistens]
MATIRPRTGIRPPAPPRGARPSRRSLLGIAAAGIALPPALSGCSYFTADTDPDALRFTFWGSPEEKDAVTSVMDMYTGTSGVTTVAEHIPGDYATKLNALVAGNIEPDAGYLPEAMAMRLGAAGRIDDLFAQGDRYPKLTGLMPSAVHQWTPGSGTMQSAVEVIMLYIDPEVCAAAGVAPPTRLDEAFDPDGFVAAADALTVDREGRHPSEAGFAPHSIERYGISGLSGTQSLYNLLHSNGCPVFDEAGTRSLFSTPEAVEVVTWVQELIHEHRVMPSPAQMQSVGGDAPGQLGSGRVAMVSTGQWELLNFTGTEMPYDVAVLPSFGQPAVMTYSGANAVFSSSPRLEETWELMNMLADPEVNPLFTNGLWMPVQEHCYRDEEFIARWTSGEVYPPGYREACIDATREAAIPSPHYSIRDYDRIDTQIGNILSSAWSGETPAREACAALDSQLEGLLQGRYEEAAL